MRATLKLFRPMIGIFIALNSGLLLCRHLLEKRGVDVLVLMTANFIFLILGVGAFLLQRKALGNKNPNVFIRGVMGTMMLRMFVVAIVVVAYAVLSGSAFNKPAVFVAMFFYLIYLAAEVATIIKLNRSKNA